MTRKTSAPAANSASKDRKYRVGRSRTGLGLFATDEFKRGETIIEYVGPRLTNRQVEHRTSKYLFETSSRWTVDGSPRSNTARYINHGCKPNAETEIIRGRIFVKARRRIRPGEEITYNYGKNYFDAFIAPHGCMCRACQP